MDDRTIFTENGDKAILLFHAYTSTPNDFLSLARELNRQAYTVYAPTFSGHGLDDPNSLLEFDMADWIKDGEEAYLFLKEKGYDDISVFGLSLGGIVANHLILKHDLPKAGVFSSPVMGDEGSKVPVHFEKWYKMMKYKQGFDKEAIESFIPKVRENLKVVLKTLVDKTDEMKPHYKDISGKIFIGQGDNDEMISPKQARDYHNALVNAQVTLKWYEGAPHVITTGRVGKELQKDLLEFLK